MPWHRRHRSTDDELLTVAALADGTLSPGRRADVLERVTASPSLSEAFERQRQVVAAIRSVATPAPSRLRARIEAEQRQRQERDTVLRRRFFAGGLASATATAALVIVLMMSGGAGDGAAVTDVATLGVRGTLEPAPAAAPGRPALLQRRAAGLPFPNFEGKFGWRTVGAREGTVEGQSATTVLYEKDGRRIAYTIVSGEPLEVPPDARRTVRAGIAFDAYEHDGAPAVTWLRRGQTCVLSGSRVEPAELVQLASWTGKGAIPS